MSMEITRKPIAITAAGTGEQTIQTVDEVGRVAPTDDEEGREKRASPVIDVGGPEADITNGEENRLRKTEEWDQDAGSDVGADSRKSETCGSHQLTGDLEPWIPVPDIVHETGQRDCKHAEQHADGHHFEVDGNVGRKNVTVQKTGTQPAENRDATEIGDRKLVDLPITVRMIDDPAFHGEMTNHGSQKNGHDE